MKMLRRLRVFLALAAFLGLTACFADPTHTLWRPFGFLARIQFFPAVLALSSLALGLLAVTFLFGRIYCSVLCPLGVFQDMVLFARRLVVRRGFPGALDGTRAAVRALRLSCLALFLGGAFLGAHAMWLEPYAIYGRLAHVTAAPLGVWLNNQAALWAERHAQYFATMAEYALPPLACLLVSAGMGLAIAALAFWKGRVWCTCVCPVGTLLALVARRAVFRPRLADGACVACGACARRCKARCIDVKAKKIDASACVMCLDCAAVCPKGAIKWK